MKPCHTIPFFLLILFAALPGQLFAYQPVKWNPLDTYIAEGKKDGPKSMTVLDGSGKELQKAIYEYTESGRLVREKYFKDGKADGETLYRYENGKLVEERLVDAAGKLVERQVFLYDSDGLISIEVQDNSGKILLRNVFERKSSQIVGGLEISSETSDRYRLKYEGERLVEVTVLDDQGQSLSTVAYLYDTKGRLTERKKIQNENQSRCVVDYNGHDRIKSYRYLNQEGTKWVTEKQFLLSYE